MFRVLEYIGTGFFLFSNTWLCKINVDHLAHLSPFCFCYLRWTPIIAGFFFFDYLQSLRWPPWSFSPVPLSFFIDIFNRILFMFFSYYFKHLILQGLQWPPCSILLPFFRLLCFCLWSICSPFHIVIFLIKNSVLIIKRALHWPSCSFSQFIRKYCIFSNVALTDFYFWPPSLFLRVFVLLDLSRPVFLTPCCFKIINNILFWPPCFLFRVLSLV